MGRLHALPLLRVLLIGLLIGLLQAGAAAARTVAPVTLLTIDGAIGPASADYAARGIARAERSGSQLVVLQIDTPGGLDTSMRTLIKAILTSPVPVAAFVAPSGARAASAGTYVVYASHIAAMAPGTNLGAATPVQLGGKPPDLTPRREADEPDSKAGKEGAGSSKPSPKPSPESSPESSPEPSMSRKALNDAAAYIRGLAQLRGRNADWAEKAVREALSLPASDALKVGVVDYVADDVPALLRQVDGRTVTVLGQARQLRTAGALVADEKPDWRARLLGVISDPSIALILMTVGVYGLLFEFMSPGAVAPGVIGALCLMLGLYGLQLLPVNYAGLGFILLGLAFMVGEAFLPSFGILGLGGIAAFVTGALILIDTELPDYGIPLGLIGTLAVGSALLIGGTAAVALRTRRKAVLGAGDELKGCIAEVINEIGPGTEGGPHEGWANVRGETWRVASNAPLHRAQKVMVLGRRGALLDVAPLEPAGGHQQ